MIQFTKPEPTKTYALNNNHHTVCIDQLQYMTDIMYTTRYLTTLAQLHSGHCRLLNTYKARITSISDVCYTTLRRTSVQLSKPSDATHRSLSVDAAKTLVQSFITCRLDYCNALLSGITDSLFRRLQSCLLYTSPSPRD